LPRPHGKTNADCAADNVKIWGKNMGDYTRVCRQLQSEAYVVFGRCFWGFSEALELDRLKAQFVSGVSQEQCVA
jgi:hypothetical protein